MAQRRRLFVLLYAASGAAALVYEVTWTRLLTLQLGHTVAAASTVLAAFMGGLALGAWVAGKRRAGTLRSYVVLELVVAVSALLLPIALGATVPALAWAYADGSAPAQFAVVRVAISLALLGVPAAAMGATFPIAADWYARNAADAGALYAVNTAGAAAGAIAAGFFLIPAVGLRAHDLGRRPPEPDRRQRRLVAGVTDHDRTKPRRAQRPRRYLLPRARKTNARSAPSLRSPRSPRFLPIVTPAPGLACAAAGLSGFAALIYEVAWTRLLALVIGPTTYAFATMAAAFISGLAIGSAVGTRMARRVERPAVWLSAMLVTSAIAASGAAWLTATRMPLLVAGQVADPARRLHAGGCDPGVRHCPAALADDAGARRGVSAGAGHGWPSSRLRRLSGRRRRLDGRPRRGTRLHREYDRGDCRSAHGGLRADARARPAPDLRNRRDRRRARRRRLPCGGARSTPNRERRTIEPSAASSAPSTGGRRSAFVVSAAVAVAAVAAILLLPRWDHELLASGAYKYAPYLGTDNVETVLRAGTLEYYKEGAAATVSVRLLTGTRALAIDGKVDASNAGDMLTQRMLGLLPVLIHGKAHDVCIIGLGSGVTLGSALSSGSVEQADVVEISPEVVEASHFFDRENGGALAKPAVRLIVGDGRSHLLLTPKQYDVIVSEPSNPWMAGVASLFTRQFFEAARARLKPDGLLCQWAHTYDISPQDLQSIVGTFASVFPQGTLWMIGGGDLLLIGARDGEILPRLGTIEPASRKGQVASTLVDVGIAEGTAPFALLSQFAGGPRELERYGAGALIQTDDRTRLEYSAPRGIYGRSREDNAAALRALAAPQPPAVRDALDRATDADWTSRGLMDLKAQAFASAYDAFGRAVALNSRNTAALSGLSDAAGGTNRLDEERQRLREIAVREPSNAAVLIELSRILAVTGDVQGALDTASEALRSAPGEPRAAEQLASVLADAGDGERLAPLADAMVARFPDRPEARYYQATALFLRGKPRDAVASAREVVAARPDHARAQSLLGTACAALGERDCALAAFGAAIRENPRDPSGYVNAGILTLQSGDSNGRHRLFRERPHDRSLLEAGARRPRAGALSKVLKKNSIKPIF